MTPDPTTHVIDAGGRYGIHPTWRGFKGELEYHLFEPDPREAERLARKYARDSHRIKINPLALGEREAALKINILRHHGQSSAYLPNGDSVWFGNTRKGEGEVVSSYEANAVTVDQHCERHGISADFLKIDTEGHEYAILKGGVTQLRHSVLGVRTEVHFDHVFRGAPLFSNIQDFMLERGFYLLNLDYTGQGAHKNGFVTGGRYGVLVSCDAVWLRRYERLFDDGNADLHALRVLKYAAFCLHNNASDVALDILLHGLDRRGLDYSRFQTTGLWRHLDIGIQRLFNALKYQPSQDPGLIRSVYEKIFRRELKQMHEYYESEETNPD